MHFFNKDHFQFREKVKNFVGKEVMPYAETWERNREIPRELWEKMGNLGFLGFCYDKEYGGQNLDVMYSVILVEELVKSRCGGLAQAVMVHSEMASLYLDLVGTDEQKKKYLSPCIKGKTICAIAVTEPDAGSDVAAISTTAVKDGDIYTLNGRKIFITNGYYGDIIITAAKTDTQVKPAYKGISLFIVEKGMHGFSVASKLEKLGTHASDTAELFYDDCRVPAKNLLGPDGSGFKTIMLAFQKERLLAAILSVAYCEQIIQDTIAYTHKREIFGTPVSSFQGNKHKLVEMVSETEMAKIFTYHCSQEYMAGHDVTKEVSMAKYVAAELSQKVARNCLQLHGGYGCFGKLWICKAYADVRLNSIAGGTTEIMKEIIAAQMGL